VVSNPENVDFLFDAYALIGFTLAVLILLALLVSVFLPPDNAQKLRRYLLGRWIRNV